MKNSTKKFIKFAIEQDILKFGEFKTKAGRLSPYFFNLGLINDGQSLKKIGEFFAEFIHNNNLSFDLLYGPAYKGISLVSSTSIALTQFNKNIPFAFNRKEIKDHGEGGQIIGHPIEGNVLILDDVISAGTSIRESVDIIKSNGGNPSGIIVAIDRQEKGKANLTAIDEVKKELHVNVYSLITLTDVINYLSEDEKYNNFLPQVQTYREMYGA
jgi:orotate phosphoribosyltransferase